MKPFAFLFCFLALGAPLASANNEFQRHNAIFNETGIDPRMGENLPLHLEFTNSKGEQVLLGDYFQERAVILTPVYYECPMLCNLLLNGLVKALKLITLTAGKDFDIVTYTIDHKETYESAARRKEHYLKLYGRPEAAEGWHFLTGSEENIRELSNAIGFRYAYDERTGEYAHGAALILATPEGRLSHYFYGVDFMPQDIRLGLVEASKKQIGNFVDQILLLCYHYDPSVGKYGLAINNALRAGGILTVLVLALFIGHSLKSERREKAGNLP